MSLPRVVADQREKFESDDLFKKLSRESEVRYTGHRDRPIEERRTKFRSACREGYTEIAFVNSGINLQLFFGQTYNSSNGCDFDKGKVRLSSSFILNGVCVRWRGSIDLERLDGSGRVEFDEQLAQAEEARLRHQMEVFQARAFLHKRPKVSSSPVSSGSASN